MEKEKGKSGCAAPGFSFLFSYSNFFFILIFRVFILTFCVFILIFLISILMGFHSYFLILHFFIFHSYFQGFHSYFLCFHSYLDYSFGQNYPIIQDCARGDYSWQFVESRSVKKSYKCNLLASRKSERQRKGTMSPSTCSG